MIKWIVFFVYCLMCQIVMQEKYPAHDSETKIIRIVIAPIWVPTKALEGLIK